MTVAAALILGIFICMGCERIAKAIEHAAAQKTETETE